MAMSREPAGCALSGAAEQDGNRIDGQHLGVAEAARDAPGHDAGAGPEIENAPRRDANAVETFEQSIMRVPHDALERGIAVAGTRELSTYRDTVERRRDRAPHGWPLCHG